MPTRSTPAPERQQRLQSPAPPFVLPPVKAPTPAARACHHYLPSPSLVQDIVQTVQSTFPYAQVAARHGVLPARVMDVLAAVVLGPLLNGSARGAGMG